MTNKVPSLGELRESLASLTTACQDTASDKVRDHHHYDNVHVLEIPRASLCLQWLVRLANSRWLSHLKEVLNTACLAAQCLERVGASVLLTEATGTDLSLAVSSLAQVILNPDTRCTAAD